MSIRHFSFHLNLFYCMSSVNSNTSPWYSKESLKKNIKYDLVSGFIVSLIALPLCLGVASASNFPPIMGVLTSIVAGLIVGFVSGSELAIKGPAAGLIVIVAGAVEEFGKGNLEEGYILTASLIAVTGLAQILLGAMKIGRWSDFIPSSVVHGMLAAIGIIVASKQIHLLIGIPPSELKGLEPLELIEKIPSSLIHLEWHISVIGISSLLLLFLLPKSNNPFIKAIPPFLVVIVFSILFVQLFYFFNSGSSFYNALIHPGNLSFNPHFDSRIFEGFYLSVTIKYFILLTLIGTIESILTVKAVDILDPYKRTSLIDKDVMAVGLGNVIAGIFGGLPMISEVARSSANINNKGVTRVSTISHGLFLLMFIMIFASIIQLIPVAALSSILIFVGYKLANPLMFKKAYKVSNEHFIVFLTTTVITVCTDLLMGVLAGMVLKMLINFIKNPEIKKHFSPKIHVESDNKQTLVQLDTVAVFTNWLSLKKVLDKSSNRKIIVDFSKVQMVDSAFIDNLHRYRDNCKDELVLKGVHELQPLKNHPHSMRMKAKQGDYIKIQLSPHQFELKSFCEENNFIISISPVVPRNYLSAFRSFKHSDIRHTSSYAISTGKQNKMEYIECQVYDPLDQLEYSVFALIAEFPENKISKFIMQKESKLDTVIDIFVKNQVNFFANPVFNSSYSVYSRDRDHVRDLFSEPIIEYFEKNDIKDLIIESDGLHRIIVYSTGSSTQLSEIRQKIDIAVVFASNLSLMTDKNKETITN